MASPSNSQRRGTLSAKNLVVRIEAPKSRLRKGERMEVRVTVSGLYGLKRPATLRIENWTVETISLTGGPVVRWRILPAQVRPDGTAVRRLQIRARRSGPFAIASSLGHLFLAHLDDVSKKWGDHKVEESMEWLNSGHRISDTLRWRGEKHGFDLSKKWEGHGHYFSITVDEVAKKHDFDTTRAWRGYEHNFYETRAEIPQGHDFEASVSKGWYGHFALESQRWEEHKHAYDKSRKWRGDDHYFQSTQQQTPGPGEKFTHQYEDTRTWQGEHHAYVKSRQWKESDPEHKFDQSQKERGERQDRWGADDHYEAFSEAWERDHHQVDVTKRWQKDDHYDWLSHRWNEGNHAYDASRRRMKPKEGK